MVHNFLILRQGSSTCLFFRLLWLPLCYQPGRQSQLFDGFAFILLY